MLGSGLNPLETEAFSTYSVSSLSTSGRSAGCPVDAGARGLNARVCGSGSRVCASGLGFRVCM